MCCFLLSLMMNSLWGLGLSLTFYKLNNKAVDWENNQWIV